MGWYPGALIVSSQPCVTFEPGSSELKTSKLGTPTREISGTHELFLFPPVLTKRIHSEMGINSDSYPNIHRMMQSQEGFGQKNSNKLLVHFLTYLQEERSI